MKSNIGVYTITNRENGKFYVGSSVNLSGRIATHKSDLRGNRHSNKYLQNSWNKYGESVFDIKIIEIADSAEEALVREQHWLDSLMPCDPSIGYNIDPIAKGKYGTGINSSNKDNYRLRKVINPEHREKTSKANRGVGNWAALLTEKDVQDVLILIRDTDLFDAEIAKLLEVEKHVINCIRTGKTWRHIKVEVTDQLPSKYSEDEIQRAKKDRGSRLSDEEAKNIKLLLRDTRLKQVDIAKMFNTLHGAISRIKKKETFHYIAIDDDMKLSKELEKKAKEIEGKYVKKTSLSIQDVSQIKILLRDTVLTHQDIGNIFKCSQSNITFISQGVNWKKVLINDEMRLSEDTINTINKMNMKLYFKNVS